MRIQVYDRNHFIIGCDDREILEIMKARMDGRKVRMKNQIIIPLKSGPKIYRFSDREISWGENTKDIIDGISSNITKRKATIKKIRDQYGRKIKFDYECKGKYTPLEHQKIIFNMILYSEISAILADPGTCKTGPYLWAIDERIKRGKIKKALVITLSNLKKNVLEEIGVQTPHLKAIVLNEKNQSNKILNKGYKLDKKNADYDIYISNYESMFSLVDLFDDDYFDMIILDEAHRVGSPGSRQTKAIIKKFEFIPYKYIITGTLHSNNLMSFFMPYRFMGPDTIPYANYYEFRRQYMFTVDPDGHIWKEVPGSRAVVRKIVGNLAVVFKKEDCLDLPPLIRQTLSCKMGREQEKLYIQMKTDLVAEVENMCGKCSYSGHCNRSCENELIAKNALVLSGKLRQIASGFYMNTRVKVDENGKTTDDTNIISIGENTKLSLLIQTLNNIPQGKKVIIWTSYRHLVEIISKRIGESFGEGSYYTCYGSQDAFEQVKKFRETEVPYMIANQSKMGVGLNIQFSSYQVFFSNSYSWIQRDQAEGRQHRKGQKEKVTVIDLVTEDTIDEWIIKALLKKQDLSMSLSEIARVLKKGKKELNKRIK